MDDLLVIGAGPAGLFSAWLASRRGLKTRVIAAGINTTHIMPGWLAVLDASGDLNAAIARFAAERPGHPYALAGSAAVTGGINALRELCEPYGLLYAGSLMGNLLLPTALGAAIPAAYAPLSFTAGDLSAAGAMLIAGPKGWRDFYPSLCAANLARQGHVVDAFAFDLPEIHAVKFDNISTGLARLFDQADVRERVAAQIKPRLNGATRVGMPAVLGLNDYPHSWRHLQDLIGVPVFEIPTLPPSVPGLRLYNVFKTALARAGVQVLLNMPVARAGADANSVEAVAVQNVVRETVYRAKSFILATGGLYGGGILSDHHGALRETIFGLPVYDAPPMDRWFADRFMPSDHPIHYAGIAVDPTLRPVDESGKVLFENVRVVGRALAGYNGPCEGSTEGVWLASAQAAVDSLFA
jgi:glycerol-3-phosphate dehydrogenase subunit B